MIIKDHQLKALGDLRLKIFTKKMVLFVRKNYPSKVKGVNDEVLKNKIAELIEQARQYGFKTEYTMTHFISLNFFHNWFGDIKNDRVKFLFEHPHFSSEEKFSIMKDLLKK